MRRRTAFMTVMTVLLSLLSAQAASAAPTWVDAADVTDTGDRITQLHVAALESSGSTSVLVWVDATTNDVVSTFRPSGGTWAAPTVLASPSGEPTIATVWAYSDGREHVEVTYSLGSTLQSVTHNLPPTNAVAVTAPTTISSSYVDGTANRSGDSLVWAEDVGGGQQQLVSDYNGAVQVEEPAAPVTYRAVAGGLLRPDDRAYFAWVVESAGGAQQLYLKGRRARASVPLGLAGSTFADLEFHTSGSLAWVEKPESGPARVRVAQIAADGAVTTADVPGGPGVAADPSIARLAGAGRVLVWREQDGNTWSIRSSTAPPAGGSWTPAVTLATGAGTLAAHHYAAATSSRGQVVSWCRAEADGCVVQGAFRAGRSWRPVTTLGTTADAAGTRLARPAEPTFGGDQDAPPTAWTDGGDDVRIAAIDHVGPRTGVEVPAITFDGSVTARMSAVDDWSSVASYQLMTALNGPRTEVPRWGTADPTTATHRRLKVAPGQTRCVRNRATDAVGNVSQYVAPASCSSAPLDDRNLRRSKAWSRVHDAKSYRQTLLRSTRRGATLTFRDYPFTDVLILVRRVPRGGTFEVLLDGRRIRVVSTAGTSRRMLALSAPARHSGLQLSRKKRDLRIRVISRGRPVLIDGVFAGERVPSAKEVNRLTR